MPECGTIQNNKQRKDTRDFMQHTKIKDIFLNLLIYEKFIGIKSLNFDKFAILRVSSLELTERL